MKCEVLWAMAQTHDVLFSSKAVFPCQQEKRNEEKVYKAAGEP